MYTPDRVFLTDLKRLDPNLGCKFEPDHEHFVITYRRPIGDEIPIMLVETSDGGFRQPNQLDIKTLIQADTHRTPLKDQLKQKAQYMECVREKKRRQAADEIRQRTIEDRRQLMPRFARLANDGGKHNSTFSRVKQKIRGKKF